MAYQNNNDNTIQTRGASATSDKSAQTPILLLTNFQNDMLKLSFCNELPAGQQTETRRFDRQNAVVTCVVREKCFTLVEAYKKLMMAKVENAEEREPVSVSVPIAGVNQLGLKLDKNEQGEWYTALFLSKGIDSETLKCDNNIEFVFPKGEYITNYDPKEGKFADRKIVENGIGVFVKDMEQFVAATSKAYVHIDRCVNKAYKDIIYENIVSIGNKMGAPMQSNKAGNSFNGGASSNPFDRGGSNTSPMSSSTMTLDELEKSLSGGGFMNVPNSGDEELPFN